MKSEPILVMSPLATVLKNAFDDYWELNPPQVPHGADGYYDWYKAQNEFVARAVAKVALIEAEGLLVEAFPTICAEGMKAGDVGESARHLRDRMDAYLRRE